MSEKINGVVDKMLDDMMVLDPGSDAVLKQAQAIKTIKDADINDRRLAFEQDKEDTRKMEKSNEYVYSGLNFKLAVIDIAIKALDTILSPGAKIATTKMNNKTRVKRDLMGYDFETDNVYGSHTFSNAQRDNYKD
jgi:hypothetical protein